LHQYGYVRHFLSAFGAKAQQVLTLERYSAVSRPTTGTLNAISRADVIRGARRHLSSVSNVIAELQ